MILLLSRRSYRRRRSLEAKLQQYDVVVGARRGEPTRKIRTTDESSLPPPPELIYRNHHPRVCMFIYICTYVCYTGQRRKMRKRWKRRRGGNQYRPFAWHIVCTRRVQVVSGQWPFTHTHTHTPLLLLFTRVYLASAESLVVAYRDSVYMRGLDPYPVTHTDILMYIILNVHIGVACGGYTCVPYTSISARDGARGGLRQADQTVTDSVRIAAEKQK
jgi:hypothetical protein